MLLFIPHHPRDEAPLQLGGSGAAELRQRGAQRCSRTRRPWLNVDFFIVRSVIYFAVGELRRLAPVRLVAAPGQGGRDRLLAASSAAARRAGCRSSALAITFAAFDWLMSLNPTWFSTIFGVYYFAGSFLSALSLLAIVTWHGAAARTCSAAA